MTCHKKLIFTFLILCSTQTIFAQTRKDVASVFKMQIFLNKKKGYTQRHDHGIHKSDSVYAVFSKLNNFKIEKLKVISSIDPYDDNDSLFSFYFIDIKNSTLGAELDDIKDQDIILGWGPTSSYILAISNQTGRSYRLFGFDSNDFFSFLEDYKNEYLEEMHHKLSTKIFLKKVKVSKLDFECLYKGLKDPENRSKYRCLDRCSDPFFLDANSPN